MPNYRKQPITINWISKEIKCSFLVCNVSWIRSYWIVYVLLVQVYNIRYTKSTRFVHCPMQIIKVCNFRSIILKKSWHGLSITSADDIETIFHYKTKLGKLSFRTVILEELSLARSNFWILHLQSWKRREPKYFYF